MDILQSNYETVLQLQADHYKKFLKGRESKANFYNALKHLSQKRSLKEFNNEIINRIDEVFNTDFDPNDLIQEEMPEFKVWSIKSKPFLVLHTCCQLIDALKYQKDNDIINSCLDLILRKINCPTEYKILVIKTVSEHILNEFISIDQGIIMEMMTIFEQFDSKNRILTDKYFKEPLNDHERLIIRASLKEGLTCSQIRG